MLLLLAGIVMAGIYPLVFLWMANVSMITEVKEILLTMAGVGMGAGILFLLLTLAYKKPAPAAVAAFVIILLFENGAFLHNAMVRILPRLRYWHTTAMLVCVGGILAYLAAKLKEPAAEAVSTALSLVFSVLVCINIITAVPNMVSSVGTRGPSAPDGSQAGGATGRNIYWLLFDEYSSNYVFEKYFNYDNSGFTGALEELGFNVSYTSENECNKTAVITANIANLDHVVEYSNDRNISEDWELVLEARKNGVLIPLVEGYGYNVVGIGNADFYGYTGTTVAAQTDSGVTMDGENVPVLFWKQTILFPFAEINTNAQAETILSQLRYLQNSENIPQSNTFVLSHINSPHTPFLFDADGGLLPANVAKDPNYYVGQCHFLNEEILKIVNTIIENDPSAMIAVLSDHGRRYGIPYDDDRRIFAALYDGGSKTDIEGFCGINVMITMLNKVFEIDMDYVEPIVQVEVSH